MYSEGTGHCGPLKAVKSNFEGLKSSEVSTWFNASSEVSSSWKVTLTVFPMRFTVAAVIPLLADNLLAMLILS